MPWWLAYHRWITTVKLHRMLATDAFRAMLCGSPRDLASCFPLLCTHDDTRIMMDEASSFCDWNFVVPVHLNRLANHIVRAAVPSPRSHFLVMSDANDYFRSYTRS